MKTSGDGREAGSPRLASQSLTTARGSTSFREGDVILRKVQKVGIKRVWKDFSPACRSVWRDFELCWGEMDAEEESSDWWRTTKADKRR